MLAVMECCTPEYVQLACFDDAVSVASLDWLARFHVFGQTLHATRAVGTTPLQVWDVGGHTALANRMEGELGKMEKNYAIFYDNFKDVSDPRFRNPSPELGSRLLAVATNVSSWIAASKWQTLIHGDFKSGNIFVRRSGDAGESASTASNPASDFARTGICVIDWQWSGWNIPTHDIIYFFSTSASDASCTAYKDCLQGYYTAFLAASTPPSTGDPTQDATLQEQLQQQYPFSELLRLFQLATLDYVRWALSYRLTSETPSAMAMRAAAHPIDVNQGEYRRSLFRLGWLLQLAERFLPLAESGELGANSHAPSEK
jgi:hypothetical protein